jgi:translocation and assembly module TamA
MKKARLVCIVLASLLLSSCVADRLKFWEKETTTVSLPFQTAGFSEDQSQVKEYVEASIKEKLVIEALPEGEVPDSDLVLYQARVIESDILKALYAKGYYNSTVSSSVVDEDEKSHALFDIKPDERTFITAISIIPALYKDELKTIDLKAGDPLEAQRVLEAQAKIYSSLQEQSCAYDLNVKHQVVLNAEMTRAEVIFSINQGKPASFGKLSYTGNETVETSYLDKLADWEEGSCFKKKRLEALRGKLLNSELFTRADPVIPEGADALDTIPVTIALKERPHRTLKAGVSYYTDEELGISLGWKHRNFFGEGEILNADLKFSMLEQVLQTTFNKPYFLRADQNLLLNASIKREDTDAYNSFALDSGFKVTRSVTDYLSVSGGLDVEFAHIKEDDGDSDDYALLSPLAEATYDTRDDTLDPHKGALIKLSVVPTMDMIGTSDPYITTQASAQSYYEAHERVVLAGRVNLGTIVGASTLNLPASKRFYAGGGGSVRGFGYQEIGPYEDGDPIGGRSIFEGSLELRYKATDKLGAVAFVDVGQVDEEVTPSFDDLAIGAGAGLRYYTDFGPLRLDVGVPLRGDENSDQNFQVYISIGQAF